MALLFILVAATVGFIIITAASALTGRATGVGDKSREEMDQRQYVLRSAARLLEDELLGDYGAYVCLEKTESTLGGTVTNNAIYLSSGLLESSAAPTFVRGEAATEPTSVLDTLVWQKVNRSWLTQTANRWDEDGDLSTLDIVLSINGDSTTQGWIVGFNGLADTQLTVLCRLIADNNFNITAEIGFATGNNVGTIIETSYHFTNPEENITLTFPSTCTEFHPTTSTEPGDNGVTTNTERFMYVWNRG